MLKCSWCKGTGRGYSEKHCDICDGKGEYPSFSEEEKQDFVRACRRTYEAIGSDLEQCARDCGERLTKAAIVEGVLDADYMDSYGVPHDIEKELRAAFIKRMKQIRYSKIASGLCRKVI